MCVEIIKVASEVLNFSRQRTLVNMRFLEPAIRMLTESPSKCMCNRSYGMGTDGKNLEDTMELFKLTESQANFLANKKRGYAILIIGAYKILAKFDIYPYEFEYFGKSGGR